MIYNQLEFDTRLEWGLHGVEELASISDVIIIVDLLSFSTCVDIATKNGAVIYPYLGNDETALDFANSNSAELAFRRKYDGAYSLSPASLTTIPANTKLVLPSPNGSALSLASGVVPTICGCLRNAKVIAQYAMTLGNKISIIPAGEQWTDKTLRPSYEDLVGAGAIISYLKGRLSPESKSALSVFLNSKENIKNEIKNCISGKELIEHGFEKDVHLACELNISNNVPVLRNNKYIGEKLE